MKNKLYTLFFFFIFGFCSNVLSEELKIDAQEINLDEKNKVIIFSGDVKVEDTKKNYLQSEKISYKKKDKLVYSPGKTKISTSEGFKVLGSNITFDDLNKKIFSDSPAKIIDNENNEISVNMFNYQKDKNLFFSKGKIEINDNRGNRYSLTELYIDEKKKKLAGSDIKVFLNQDDFKIDPKNEPRLFANTAIIDSNGSFYDKGNFTYCKNRGEDKCPPWSIQAKKIEHSAAKKTIYYDNAVVKIYDFPIFYFPRLSHPDPTVDRRSGFLIPSGYDNSNLGFGINIPYYFNLGNNKDFTFTPRFYANENPLLNSEYRHNFKNSDLRLYFGFSEGYKNKSNKKLAGSKKYLFSKLSKELISTDDIKSKLEVNVQQTNSDSFIKAFGVDTPLVNKDDNILENSVKFDFSNKNTFVGFNMSAFENQSLKNNKKFEYLLPYVTFDKNLEVAEKYGLLDFSSNLRIRNYEVNKQSNLLVNDLNWQSKRLENEIGLDSKFLASFKNINYKTNNVENFKEDATSELSSAFGYFAKMNFFKINDKSKNSQYLTPKILFKYSPHKMREIDDGRLRYSNLYNLKKLNEFEEIESGTNISIGFDYSFKKFNENIKDAKDKFKISLGQVINESEDPSKPARSSLDQRFSDVVGESSFMIKDNFKINYEFAIDQNYSEFNYNEIGVNLEYGIADFNLDYLEERNHIGNNNYVKSNIKLKFNNNNEMIFSSKRNLETSSSEFYSLSYDYINDCLKAGLVYRREFYNDSDLEPTDSLIFKISLIPFSDLKSPGIN